MENDLLVSVITVSFNSGATIARTIESVLRQSYRRIEYIVLDGGSSDNSVSILNNAEQKFQGRMKWRSESDGGMYDAMNKGIALASGELIGILNSDDWYEPDAVETIVDAFQNDGDAIYYGLMKVYDKEQSVLVRGVHHSRLGEENINHPACFVPKALYQRHGTFDLAYRSAADYDLMLRFLKQGVKFVSIDKIIANFALGGLTTIERDFGIIESYAIRKKYGFISPGRAWWEVLKIRLKASLRRIGIRL